MELEWFSPRRAKPTPAQHASFAKTPPLGDPSRRVPIFCDCSHLPTGGATLAGPDPAEIYAICGVAPVSATPMRALDPQSLTRHIDRLYRAAWALCGSREDAEDLVQDTFARVLSKPRMLRGDDDLAYLMRVLRNTFFTSRRTASRRPVKGPSIEEVVAADPQPTHQPEHALEVRELYAAVAKLPDDFRLALVAVDILGLSYREAAGALRTREATITSRLFRARRQVARLLADDPPPDADGIQTNAIGAQTNAVETQTKAVTARAQRDGAQRDDAQTEGLAPTQRKFAPVREGEAPHERLAEQGQP